MIITKENLFFFLPKDRQIVDTITGKHKYLPTPYVKFLLNSLENSGEINREYRGKDKILAV